MAVRDLQGGKESKRKLSSFENANTQNAQIYYPTPNSTPKYLLYTVARNTAANATTAAVRFSDFLLDPEVDSNSDGS